MIANLWNPIFNSPEDIEDRCNCDKGITSYVSTKELLISHLELEGNLKYSGTQAAVHVCLRGLPVSLRLETGNADEQKLLKIGCGYVLSAWYFPLQMIHKVTLSSNMPVGKLGIFRAAYRNTRNVILDLHKNTQRFSLAWNQREDVGK